MESLASFQLKRKGGAAGYSFRYLLWWGGGMPAAAHRKLPDS